MKIYWIILITILMLCPQLLLSQTALQEIVRFTPANGQFIHKSIQANGDINGDGTNDLVFGCGTTPDPSTCYGNINIYHSIPSVNAIPDQIITYPTIPYTCGFGNSISYSGDLNGDGKDDLVVGSLESGENNSGYVHVYYGGDSLSAQPDLTLYGDDYLPGDDWHLCFGDRVYSDCDINGDGYDDLIVWASGLIYTSYGDVFVFLGGEQLSTTCALHIAGTVEGEKLGRGLCTGDINGDGFDDIVLWRRTQITGDEDCNYTLDVYAGGNELSNIPVFETILGSSTMGFVSNTVLANGDLNGDGFDDILATYTVASGTKFQIIYGDGDFESLALQEQDIPLAGTILPMFFCNLDNDIFSDFCMSRNATHNGEFLVYKQTCADFDFNCDFNNSGDLPTSYYLNGNLLGDMNHDNKPEFFVYTFDGIHPNANYATILNENYTGIDDEVLPKPEDNIICYPNPFRDRINVKIKSSSTKSVYDIAVYDIKGRKVYSRNKLRTDEFSWTPAKDCKVPISSGIYLMQITENNRPMSTSKIIYTK